MTDKSLGVCVAIHRAGHYVRHRRYGLVKITDIAKADEDVTVTMDTWRALPKSFHSKPSWTTRSSRTNNPFLYPPRDIS